MARIPDRRTFMKLLAAGLSSALGALGACARKIGQVAPTTQYPTPEMPLTPPEAWYSVSLTGAYEGDVSRYRLLVGGAVRRAQALNLATLRREFPAYVQPITLACVGNQAGGGLVSSALFRGARLADVLEHAGVSGDVLGAAVTGLEGYLAYRALEDLRRPEVLLAYDMGTDEGNLAPLSVERGFPLRLLTPGFYGYVQPKWLDAITVRDRSAHFEVLRRSVDHFDGRMQLASGFSRPLAGDRLVAGEHDALGFAFGDGRPIGRVELRVDDGAYQPAAIVWNDLTDGLPPHVWSLWRARFRARPGRHRLTCRATYADGETQITGRAFPYSGGSLASIDVDVTETA